MGSEYATDARRFVTHEEVTWRESVDGISALLAVGTLDSLLVIAVAMLPAAVLVTAVRRPSLTAAGGRPPDGRP